MPKNDSMVAALQKQQFLTQHSITLTVYLERREEKRKEGTRLYKRK